MFLPFCINLRDIREHSQFLAAIAIPTKQKARRWGSIKAKRAKRSRMSR